MTKKQEKIYNWLLSKPGYLKFGYSKLCELIDGSPTDIKIALKQARSDSKQRLGNSGTIQRKTYAVTGKAFKDTVWGKKMAEMSRKTMYNKQVSFIPSRNLDPNNVIFLPDLHAPFIKDGVLEFCKEQQLRYNCGKVIFAGDIIDGHAWSYHEHDPDGMSVGHEIGAAIQQLQPWYKAFPEAISCMGNHDLLIQRKARTIGLSKHFIKGFGEVIGAPSSWKFVLEHKQDNVLYKHGNVGDAFKVAKESRMSTCQGHFHAKTFVQWSVSERDSIFGMQVGWGADRHAYAFDYGKPFAAKPIISLGLILDRGRTPIVKLMDL